MQLGLPLKRSRRTRYTLWSSDRLLGEIELERVAATTRTYAGALVPALFLAELVDAPTATMQLELRGPDGRLVRTTRIILEDSAPATLQPEPDILGALADADVESQPRDVTLSDEFDVDAGEPDGFWSDYTGSGDRVWADAPARPRYRVLVELREDAALP